MRSFRDPAVLVLIGLILLLVPAAIGLVHLYDQAQGHHRTRDLPSLPSPDALLEIARQFDAGLTVPRIEGVYRPSPATCPHCRKLKEDLLDQGLPELENRLVFVSRGKRDLQEYPSSVRRDEREADNLFWS